VRRNRKGQLFTSFGPQVSAISLKAMRQEIRELNFRRRTQIRLVDIAQKLNPILQGWLNYYGRFCPTAMNPMWRYVNATWLRGRCESTSAMRDGKCRRVN